MVKRYNQNLFICLLAFGFLLLHKPSFAQTYGVGQSTKKNQYHEESKLLTNIGIAYCDILMEVFKQNPNVFIKDEAEFILNRKKLIREYKKLVWSTLKFLKYQESKKEYLLKENLEYFGMFIERAGRLWYQMTKKRDMPDYDLPEIFNSKESIFNFVISDIENILKEYPEFLSVLDFLKKTLGFALHCPYDSEVTFYTHRMYEDIMIVVSNSIDGNEKSDGKLYDEKIEQIKSNVYLITQAVANRSPELVKDEYLSEFNLMMIKALLDSLSENSEIKKGKDQEGLIPLMDALISAAIKSSKDENVKRYLEMFVRSSLKQFKPKLPTEKM